MYILVVGDAFSGFAFYGPFEFGQDASDYGEANFPHDTWSIGPIEKTA